LPPSTGLTSLANRVAEIERAAAMSEADFGTIRETTEELLESCHLQHGEASQPVAEQNVAETVGAN